MALLSNELAVRRAGGCRVSELRADEPGLARAGKVAGAVAVRCTFGRANEGELTEPSRLCSRGRASSGVTVRVAWCRSAAMVPANGATTPGLPLPPVICES